MGGGIECEVRMWGEEKEIPRLANVDRLVDSWVVLKCEAFNGLECPLHMSTALGEHTVRSHGGAMVVVVATILAHELDVTVRRAFEAFWIAAKCPKIGHKDESIAGTLGRPLPHCTVLSWGSLGQQV